MDASTDPTTHQGIPRSGSCLPCATATTGRAAGGIAARTEGRGHVAGVYRGSWQYPAGRAGRRHPLIAFRRRDGATEQSIWVHTLVPWRCNASCHCLGAFICCEGSRQSVFLALLLFTWQAFGAFGLCCATGVDDLPFLPTFRYGPSRGIGVRGAAEVVQRIAAQFAVFSVVCQLCLFGCAGGHRPGAGRRRVPPPPVRGAQPFRELMRLPAARPFFSSPRVAEIRRDGMPTFAVCHVCDRCSDCLLGSATHRTQSANVRRYPSSSRLEASAGFSASAG